MHAPSSLSEWPDLPQDVLREISGRLRDSGDLVRFHAVCKPWRDTAGTPTTTKQCLLPWLLAPDKRFSIFLKLRCIFSRTSYRALPPFSFRERNWVTSEDGRAVWYLAEGPNPSLRDTLTGAVAFLLPPFPQKSGRWEGPPSGVVYRDGTVFLRRRSYHDHDGTAKLRAALLRPGDAAWMVVERTFRSADLKNLYLSYYRGKMLMVVNGPVVTPDDEAGVGDVLAVQRPSTPCEMEDDYFYVQSYVVESGDELLCVSMYVRKDYPRAFGGKASVSGLLGALLVRVHALEDENRWRWVSKHGGSLSDRVLFLGYPNSFAVESSRLSGDAVSGGCAYFVYQDLHVKRNQPCFVFRYNLIEDKAMLVEQLPQGWYGDVCTWIFRQPSIAPIQVYIQYVKNIISYVIIVLTPFGNKLYFVCPGNR
jgi:hypothetical protein